MSEQDKGASASTEAVSVGGGTLNPAAGRALAEAAARRAKAVEETHAREINGRGGAEPVRFGDWEVKGLATDF